MLTMKQFQEPLSARKFTRRGITARGILFNFMIRMLEEIHSGTLNLKGTKFVLSKSDTVSLRQILQVDIISILMMLIEDLVILLEANRIANGNYYSLLDTKGRNENGSIVPDVGQRVTEFFDNLNNFSDRDWREMLCYINPSDLANENHRPYVASLVESNINSLKELFNQLHIFRKTHSQVFRRFKHAGLAIRFGLASKDESYPFTSKKFDSMSLVFAEIDPFSGPIPIPYSNEVIDSYKFLAVALTNLLKEAASNKMSCLERWISELIPLESYSSGSMSVQKRLIFLIIIGEFNQNFPVKPENFVHLENKTVVSKDKVEWYAKLDSFLDYAKNNRQLCSHTRDQITKT